MTAQPLRIGFAGANASRGWARDAHLAAVQATPDLIIHAISARTQTIAGEAAQLFGACKAYDDSLALALDPDIDIIAVTVKVPEHRAIVLAALRAGKHVYCEWPLGRDLEEAQEMAAAARTAGVHVAIGLQGANSVAVRHAAQLVRDRAIGRPLSLRVVSPTAGWGQESPSHYAYLQDKRNGATLETIAGGHTLAAVEAVLGPYVDVSARASILIDKMGISGSDEVVTRTCADHLLVSGLHESGCVSSVEVIGGVMNTPFVFELRGASGSLTLTGGHAGGYQAGNLTVATHPKSEAQPAPAVAGLHGPPANVAELWARFANDIRTGARTTPDFERAVRLAHLLDALETSSAERRSIRIGRA